MSWKFNLDATIHIDQVATEGKYAIRLGGSRMNRDGEWEYEPMPSHRTDEFLARCTFDSLKDAVEAYHKHQGD